MTIKFPKFEDFTLVVVGDAMLDRYWQGATNRISPEAPVPVVHVQEVDERPGGAANVALNLKSLGCKVILLGMIGEDEAGDVLERCLHSKNVRCHLQRIPNQSTLTKLRVLGRNQQLIRLDFEQSFHTVDNNTLTHQFKSCLAEADGVIFSDYGKGTLVAIEEMIAIARTLNKPIFVDPKRDDFSAYQYATIITPNLKEFQQVVGQCASEADLVMKAQSLIAQYHLQALLVTRGEEGASLVLPDAPAIHLRAHGSEVYDVSGAGDTVIATLAAFIAAGYDFAAASAIANTAAGIVVRKAGVATVSLHELRRSMMRYQASDLRVLNEEDLMVTIEDARAHGEKIVMTNGCFDILHPGHITYLQQAKSLGDRLIVAVNDDHSVRQLKGNQRPLNKLEDRMMLLSALRCVDWVVSFGESTPERLIARILPDVLVKGGDYALAQVAGSRQVLAHGGDVKILSLVEGYSTTSLIQKIREEDACLL